MASAIKFQSSKYLGLQSPSFLDSHYQENKKRGYERADPIKFQYVHTTLKKSKTKSSRAEMQCLNNGSEYFRSEDDPGCEMMVLHPIDTNIALMHNDTTDLQPSATVSAQAETTQMPSHMNFYNDDENCLRGDQELECGTY